MNSKARIILNIFWIIIGATLITLSLLEIVDETMYAGMGGALIAVGILNMIRSIRYKKNKEYKEMVDTEVSDERNKFLRMKSWSWTGYIVIILEAVASLVCMVLKFEALQMVFLYSVCAITFIYWISYMVLSRKY